MIPHKKSLHDKDFSLYITRRKELIDAIQEEYPADSDRGFVILWAGFESERAPFRQESSFYYLTGITEPGVVMVIDIQEETTTLFVPNCMTERAQWMASAVPLTEENAEMLGVDEIGPLGAQCAKYQIYPFFPREEYADLCALLTEIVENKGVVFTLTPNNQREYVEQRFILERVKSFVPGFGATLKDISPLVAEQRRRKDMHEIELLYAAIGVTVTAHEAAAQMINHNATEAEVQATLEYMMTASNAQRAFPSIVATGRNSTILHYTLNNSVMSNGELVVVDIGAEHKGYCADLTRTYPVSGVFSKRQRELYDIVLDTQEYIANIAQPGYWINNKEQPEKSLMHLTKKYLSKYGYEQYFTHGIGHFLGLDVHDVGDYTKPLQEGDVFTIEPGLYIPQEGIGIRIEDDYWMVKKSVVCLSEELPKKAEQVEIMMQQVMDESEDDDEEMNDLNNLFEDEESN